MAVIGDFTPTETTDVTADPDTFTFFGEEFTIPATVGAGAVLKFSALMKGAVAQEKRGQRARRTARSAEARDRANTELLESEMTAQSAIYELLTSCLGAEQVDSFLTVGDANGVTLDALMEVADRIQEAIAGRPTRRSADSSDGPSTSGTPSTDGGSGSTEDPDLTAREQQAALMETASVGV